MYTNKEIEAVKLSTTKKDFVQIWNELLDTAKKLSDRWNPSATNESDPGIVLLKVLAALGDTLNYNVDKNILEAFMPSASQAESMRRLCEMMGYNIKYHQSAVCNVRISYVGETSDDTSYKIVIPKWTSIKSSDETVNYLTTKELILNTSTSSATNNPTDFVDCIEGSLHKCETDNNNLITINLLDDNNRYFLPETAIAENGIFVYNATESNERGTEWTKVDNLNAQAPGTSVWKFGYSSALGLPYVQFPADISDLINDGLIIEYIRTSGADGNIANGILSNIAVENISTTREASLTDEDFSVSNIGATTNGANIESMDTAYFNFKKTIGTFDTLVTCRDYMNKIYQLTEDTVNQNPLVSNVIVSDIRDDINRSITLCSFNEYGICYNTSSLKNKVCGSVPTLAELQQKTSPEVSVGDIWYVSGEAKYYKCTSATDTISTWEEVKNFKADKINAFDLVIYPYKTYTTTTAANYAKSFDYTAENLTEIKSDLEQCKTLSHNIVSPVAKEIVCIKNYLRLKAKITTTYKVNKAEETVILENVYSHIYDEFNLRNIDFGEEINTELILNCIKEADTRIKDVSLEDPVLYTKFKTADNEEYDLGSTFGKGLYNKLALRNILAGRIALFNYDTNFRYDYTDGSYGDEFEPAYGADENTYWEPEKAAVSIIKMVSDLTIGRGTSVITDVDLTDNEVIQFRAPNFKTTVTYPAYVNYYLILKKDDGTTRDLDRKIPANSYYELRTNEHLLINYTKASTDDSDSGEIVNEDLPAGTIIYPNFELTDSNIATTFPKQSGFKESWKTTYNTIGMLTLATTEQIELKEKAEVKIKDSTAYLYWILQDNGTENDNGKKIVFTNNEYTLNEGEYLFYTDQYKTGLISYGNGTKLVKEGDFTMIKEDDNVSLENIIEDGISAIPWIKYNFNTSRYLTVAEYQYVNLIKGDNLADSTITKIEKAWKPLSPEEAKAIKYTLADGTKGTLPTLGITGINWDVRSKLEFNVGPTTMQTLVNTDKKTDKITLYGYKANGTEEKIKDLEAVNSNRPLSIKTNKLIQTANTTVDTHIYEYDSELKPIKPGINNFKVRVFKYDDEIAKNINAYSDCWYKLTSKAIKEKQADPIKLNIDGIKEDLTNYGLMMIYYNGGTTEQSKIKDKNIYFTTTNTSSPVIFNNFIDNSDTEIWWDGYSESNKYYLKPGINVIKFTKNTTVSFYAAASVSDTESLIYSALDIVKINGTGTSDGNDKGLNLSVIDYQYTGTATSQLTAEKAKELLKNLREVDPEHNFYYNCILDNSNVIDLNTTLTGEDKEILSTPSTWYDYNNMNNKFVVSEIDASYLSTGITLYKTSKL